MIGMPYAPSSGMSKHALSLVTVILALSLLGSASALPVADHRMMISGTLEVVEQDLHGVPKTLDLLSPELGRFRIASDARGRKLLAHAGAWVTVVGNVELVQGVRVVRVEGFRLLTLQSRSSAALAV